jgi:hypothetical protein
LEAGITYFGSMAVVRAGVTVSVLSHVETAVQVRMEMPCIKERSQ